MSNNQFSTLPTREAGNLPEQQRAFSNFSSSLPVAGQAETERWFPPLVVLPSVPAFSGEHKREFAASFRPPITEIPATPEPTVREDLNVLPEIVLPPETAAAKSVTEGMESKAAAPSPSRQVESPLKAVSDFTDSDLAEALAPIMRNSAPKEMQAKDIADINGFLEPLLRATVRRALAEYSPASRPFQPPGFVDRTVWRLQALFSSRTFEDVLFEKTHRFHIEEVYLLDVTSLALISFASCDPARHSTVKRIEGSAKRIALQIRNQDGQIRRSFEQADGRNVISETGKHMILVAIVRGQPNEMILADLEFSLLRIEDHFHERFEQAGSALMHAMQPFLEDCLLIQSPASAA